VTPALTPNQIQLVREILQRHLPGRDVRIYGSRARGTARRYSDLDLMIMDGEPVALGTLGDLKEAFVESDLPFKVDVSEWRALSTAFRDAVMADLVAIPQAAE
jgi:type I restriction enzyme S subunit